MKKPLTFRNIGDLSAKVEEWGGDAGRLNLEFDSLDISEEFPASPPADPFSDEYVDYQIALYRAIANRELDQSTNEHTAFDYEKHLKAANPYASSDVMQMARHVATISAAIIRSGLAPGAKMLDMGCGWGLSTELLSFLGASVTSVDINADFVRLVNERCSARGYGANAIQSGFDEAAGRLPGGRQFDGVLFYECLHHAVRPWTVLEDISRVLVNGGKLLLAGEPIQEIWWPSWGMRLDPLSVFCIHQFGWFESGWSQSFLAEMAARAGFVGNFVYESEIGADPLFVATLNARDERYELPGVSPGHGWEIAESGWTSLGDSEIALTLTDPGDAVEMVLWNNRGSDIAATFATSVEKREVYLRPGVNRVMLKGATRIAITAETWCPAKEFGTDDNRRISFTLTQAQVVSATVAAAA